MKRERNGHFKRPIVQVIGNLKLDKHDKRTIKTENKILDLF